MTTIAWLTLALACMAFIQAIATITNAIEIHKRRKVAEKQYELEREKFEYQKQLDEGHTAGTVETENNLPRMLVNTSVRHRRY